jgi:GntR family transcriptional regulator
MSDIRMSIMNTVLRQEPLYAKLRNRLAELVRSGALKPGDRLPSEHRLAEEYAVSRATVREAVRALIAEGILTTRQGQGTFVVAKPPIESGLEELDTVTGMIERHGYRAGTAGTQVAIEAADHVVARALEIREGAPVVCIERIRTADGEPVVLSRNKFPQVLLPEVSELRTLDGSLLEFLEAHSRIRVVRAITTLRPVVADADLARRMTMEVGSAFLLFEQVHYTEDNRPCLVCEDYYRADKFRFRVVRRRRVG